MEKERGEEKERWSVRRFWIYADVGRERETLGGIKNEIPKGGKGQKRQRKRSVQERKRGERRDGADPRCDRKNYSQMSDEDERIGLHPGAREWSRQRRGPITYVEGRDGDCTLNACAAGVGTRVHAQSPDNLLPSLLHCCFCYFYLTCSTTRLLLCSILPFSTLCLSLALKRYVLSFSLSLWGRNGKDHRSRPSAHDPRPRGRVVIHSGVLSIWVIANANKDNTWRTIISTNYIAYRI